MRRGFNQTIEPSVPEPSHFFPLTANATDVTGDWGTLSGSCAGFNADGAFFNGSVAGFQQSLQVPNSEFAVVDFEYMFPVFYASGVYRGVRMPFENAGAINVFYAPDWGQDLNCSIYSASSTYTALSLAEVPFTVNKHYRITIRQNLSQNTSDLFINGEHRNHGTICIPSNRRLRYLCIGRMENSSTGRFKGYIRNFRTYNVELTDEQIAAI